MSFFIRSPCMLCLSKICSERAKMVKNKKRKFKRKNSKKFAKVFLMFLRENVEIISVNIFPEYALVMNEQLMLEQVQNFKQFRF